jgi:xanthine dehydrogenase/oxidase
VSCTKQVLSVLNLPYTLLQLVCFVFRYDEQSKEIAEFNQSHRWKKRGISIIPTKFTVGFGNFLDQGGALVKIYKDGSVLVAHGGCEMGQGLHTKMIQVASQVLGVDHNSIHIMETATDKVGLFEHINMIRT